MICPHCNGEGWVQTFYGKEWSNFFRSLLKSDLDIFTANEKSILLMDEKYPHWQNEKLEAICEQCDGTGTITE